MDYFKNYVSNTLAASGNQSYYVNADPDKVYKSRVCYKVFCGSEYNYSVLFSNIIDSTYSNGSFSHRNLVIDSWKIHRMRIGVTDYCDKETVNEPYCMYNVTFNGKEEKTVNPGEFFSTDAVRLSPKSGEYICIELEFSGKTIPYHEQSLVPSFIFEGGKWIFSKQHPFPSMLGCNRSTKSRIAFWGDSITQGSGTEINSYAHWNSVVAENIGTDYSFWNLGLGFGRADDAASDGAWLFKAKQNDIVAVCYGVNDILQGYSEEEIKHSLDTIVDKLNAYGIKIIVQTVPPFDFQDEKLDIWNNVNNYIRKELAERVEFVFDCTKILGKSEKELNFAKYGGHPNADGHKIWGDEFSASLKKLCLDKAEV